MEGQGLLAHRFEQGHKYLQLLRRPNQPPWPDRYARYLRDELALVEALTLIHPAWLPNAADRELIVPDRGFGQTAPGQRCQSQALWLYPCDLPRTSLHADHLFPYSLGGPTVVANRLALCDVHNRIKGADVHLFPWEQPEPRWLEPLLARYAEFM